MSYQTNLVRKSYQDTAKSYQYYGNYSLAFLYNWDKPEWGVVYRNTCIDQPTNQPTDRVTWYWYVARAYSATPCHIHVCGGEECSV